MIRKSMRKYRIIRSSRKTVGLEMTADGLLVRAPRTAGKRTIERAIKENEAWIAKAEARMNRIAEEVRRLDPLTPEDIKALAQEAKKVIPKRVEYYAKIIGVAPGRITIRNQKTKWGSCSAKGNLNFNCLLMLTPPEVLDSIVVHELCHLKEMNHSRRFYDEVLKAYPEYRKWNKWLKENGGILMRRMEEGKR